MNRFLLSACILAAMPLSLAAQEVSHGHVGAGPPKPSGLRTGPQGPMAVDNWASLGTYAELPTAGAGRGLDVKVLPDNTEQITVYGTRSKRDREWRDELRDSAGPGYEPSTSEAGQPEYARSPSFLPADTSPALSSAKSATGACGALFGLITC